MESLGTGALATLPVLALFFTQVVKNLFKNPSWMQPFLPVIPMLFCFGLSFVPGLDVSMTMWQRILLAAGAGGFSTAAFKTGREVKKLVRPGVVK